MKRRLSLAGIWIVSVLEALAMGIAGLSKFGGGGRWQVLFIGWGYPVWFSYVIGVLEVGGALALLAPRIAAPAAMMLGGIMIGAALTLITHPGPMGWATPVVHFGLLAVIAIARFRTGSDE